MKKSWMMMFFLILVLVGCNENTTTHTVDEGFTTTIESTTIEVTELEPTEGMFILEYPDKTVELRGEIGSKVVIPELIKDDYVFIGWSDGSDYYAGLTEVVPGTINLTPEYVSVESVFTKLDVFLGQVSLVNYYGEYEIVGLPMYWHGYLVVGFSTTLNTIDSFYGPSSLDNVSMPLVNMTNVVAYGDEAHAQYKRAMSQIQLIEKIEGCTYEDGGEIDLDQITPGQLNDGCEIKVILKRNDEDAITLPGKGTYYTYDVLVEGELWVPNHFYHATYISIEAFSSVQQVFLMFSRNYDTLEGFDLPSSDLITVNNNQVIGDVNGEDVIFYIHSNEEVLYLNGDEQPLNGEALFVGGNLKAIEVENVEGLTSIDGVLYQNLYIDGEELEDETYLQILAYPKGKEDKHFIMPDNLVRVFNLNRIDNVDTITINERVVVTRKNQAELTISHLISYFPNLKTIHVPEGHPYMIEEDGIIYDINKEMILYVNESVSDLVIQEGVQSMDMWSLYNRGAHFDSVYLNQGVEEEFLENSINHFTADSISVDPNNPYIKMEDGIIYDMDETKILYIDPSLESLVLKSTIVSINQSINISNHIKNIELNGLVSNLPNFDRFTRLEAITMNNDNPNFQLINGCLYRNYDSHLSLVWVPIATDMSTIYIPERAVYASLSRLTLLNEMVNIGIETNINWFEVDENNTALQSISGIIYDQAGERILYVPPNYSMTQYEMPDTVTEMDHYFGMYVEDFVGQMTSIHIGGNYEFMYEKIEFGRDTDGKMIYQYAFDNLTKYLNLVDTITIDSNSPYYDENYHMITTLNQDTLLAFTGDYETYEVPDYIKDFSVLLFNDATKVKHMIFNSVSTEIPEALFMVDQLETITIKGTKIMKVEGFEDDVYNAFGDSFHYLESENIIIYVEASMVEAYQNHPFWSFYEIRAIE